MPFHLDKIYIDWVTDDGLAMVVYVIRTRSGFYSRLDAGLEYYGPEGDCRVYKATHCSSFPTLETHCRAKFTLQAAGHPMRLVLEPLHGGWNPGHQQPAAKLSWQVLSAQMRVSMQWAPLHGDRWQQGIGYCDRVVMSQVPRRFKIRALQWGRIHQNGESAVFNRVSFAGQPGFQRAFHWDGTRRFREYANYSLNQAGDSWSLQLGEPGLDNSRGFQWKSLRCLHQGRVIHKSRFPSAIERLFLRLLLGAAKETRWLGCHTGEGGNRGWALHEAVFFGHNSGDAP